MELSLTHLRYTRNTKTPASAVSFRAVLSCRILDIRQWLSVSVDGITEDKATEYLST